jgi:tetracycline resistance efflux pump
MDHVGILSLLPPLVAIVLAILTRQVYLSLLSGIFLGYLVLSSGQPIAAFMSTIQGMVDVFADPGNTRTILFCALVGGLLILVKRSGGVDGFLMWMTRKMDQTGGMNPRRVQMYAFITGIIVFVETSISALTVGSIFRPLFDRVGVSRDKLAYLADSSSAPSSILIPFNAWGAFIMSLLIAGGIDQPFGVLVRSMVYNFYPVLTIALGFVVILKNWNIGPMRQSERRNATIPDSTQETSSEDWITTPAKPGIIPLPIYMVLPLAVMVISMPMILVATGWSSPVVSQAEGLLSKTFQAMGAGSGSTAVLTAVILSLLVAAILYKIKGVMRISEWMDWTLKGSASLLPLALLMLLAFAIGDVCKAMGTGLYVAESTTQWLSPKLLPALIFIITSFIAFSTGTSWGTFAIMMSIALPMAQQMDVNMYPVIAAVLGGGVFGDHCSPISDTTIISSLSAGTEHISHVRTQLPYALIAGAISIFLYLLVGYL